MRGTQPGGRGATRPLALEGDTPPYDEYLATRIEVSLDGGQFVVRAADGASGFPNGVAVVHVVTAENPWPTRLTDVENAERVQRLRAEMASRYGEEGAAWGPAGTTTDAVDLGEAGVAICDRPRTEILGLAEAHGQSSVAGCSSSGQRCAGM